MLRTVIVAAVASGIGGVRASPAIGNTEDIIGRVQNQKAGDACHPLLTNVTFNCNTRPIAPCISEQFVTSSCEKLSRGNDAAYRACIKGSTFRTDQDACVACKADNGFLSKEQAAEWRQCHEEAWQSFTKANSTLNNVWTPVAECMQKKNWLAGIPAPPPRTVDTPIVPLEVYWKNPVVPQGIGAFTIGNNTYPKDIDGAECLPEGTTPLPSGLDEPMESRDPIVQLVEGILSQGSGDSQAMKALFYYGQRVVMKFQSWNTVACASFVEEGLLIADIPAQPATKDEVKALPAIPDKQKSISTQDIKVAAAAPATSASDEGSFLIKKVEEAQPNGQSGQIDPSAKDKIVKELENQFGNTASTMPNIQADAGVVSTPQKASGGKDKTKSCR